MASTPLLLSLSVCFLILFHGCSARSRTAVYGDQNECQLNRLEAREPDHRVECEGGMIESWNPNHEQFQCAGVALLRLTIQPNGLHLPSYTNGPQLIHVIRGRGVLGTLFPGCAETFEEAQVSVGGGRSSQRDRHQKTRHIKEGDIIAIPAGMAYWCNNDGDQPLVTVNLIDVSNHNNQLDLTPRRFYIAGNPHEDFPQSRRTKQGRRYSEESQERIEEEKQQEGLPNNVFRGFSVNLIQEAFNVDSETARKIQSQDDFRGSIIRVEGKLDLVKPQRSRQEQEQEMRRQELQQTEREHARLSGRDYNGLEENICTMRLRENMGDPARADVFSPQAGRLTTVVDNNGRSVFEGELRQGQALTVPQNFAIVKMAENEGFEWISFKTNDRAKVNQLAGKVSFMRAMPENVIANSYQISREQARRLKVITMANTKALLSLSFCFFLLLQGTSAISRSRSRSQDESYRQQNQCQIDRIEAREPDTRVEAEAGLIESWNPNHNQFQCAGVAVVRYTIQQNGLHLPSYTNTPQLVYIVKGRGILGVTFPGCPETFEESQRGQGQGQSQGSQPDRHQKLRHVREGDIVAIPAGVAYWSYNNGDQQLVFVSLLDTSNVNNQLDDNPRRFYLAGNPEDEFEQLRREGGRGARFDERIRERSEGRHSSENYRNIFKGFNSRYLEEAFNVDSETVKRLQGQNDDRNSIIRVKGTLDLVSPLRSSQEHQREERYEDERQREIEQERRRMSRGGRYEANGLEETFCSMRLRENIGDPSRADVFTPQAGRISTVNSYNLPILRFLQLSAERGVLYKNAIYTPHWNVNAHSVMYVLRGRARVQVVNHMGQKCFDGEVRQGQIVTVPQNHAVVKQASSDGFEWVSFKTNDNAWVSPLAGRTSVIRALPEAVLANAFQISRDQARNLKYNREETVLLTSSTSSRREDRYERRATA
ncbi:hypothetical protein F8388_009441 [Cannabis sativa]|uniref:11S seed storage protein n=2 Tax=Cannabis sativa TaxID=3483 RepID=A0A7J6EI91_CANSA|nr:hypothetical protein F8388_009441 [Cannabis sativa]